MAVGGNTVDGEWVLRCHLLLLMVGVVGEEWVVLHCCLLSLLTMAGGAEEVGGDAVNVGWLVLRVS
jgi:hypothetical protein